LVLVHLGELEHAESGLVREGHLKVVATIGGRVGTD
jgi:hypothetical protein